jgi:enamine deaminase RidA (YjgF/YER057c/UK114 family)
MRSALDAMQRPSNQTEGYLIRAARRRELDRLNHVCMVAKPAVAGGGPVEIVGTTMQEQTRQSLRNVKTVLEAAGSSLDRIVKITVLLARPDLYKEMNEAYAEFFPGPKPARAMARFGADIPGVLVAIEAIATVGTTS